MHYFLLLDLSAVLLDCFAWFLQPLCYLVAFSFLFCCFWFAFGPLFWFIFCFFLFLLVKIPWSENWFWFNILLLCTFLKLLWLSFLDWILHHLLSIILQSLPFTNKMLRTFIVECWIGFEHFSIFHRWLFTVLRLANFNKLPTTIALMLLPPRIGRLRFSIHRPLNIAKERRLLLTYTITPPHMGAITLHLISETVINRHSQLRNRIDIMHYLLEFLPMSTLRQTCSRVCNEKKRVDHLV